MSDTTYAEWMKDRKYTKEQIEQVRAAILEEKRTKAMFDDHEERLAQLHSDYEMAVGTVKVMSGFADELKKQIEEEEKKTFDYSDDMTIAAAEDMLEQMEKVYNASLDVEATPTNDESAKKD